MAAPIDTCTPHRADEAHLGIRYGSSRLISSLIGSQEQWASLPRWSSYLSELADASKKLLSSKNLYRFCFTGVDRCTGFIECSIITKRYDVLILIIDIRTSGWQFLTQFVHHLRLETSEPHCSYSNLHWNVSRVSAVMKSTQSSPVPKAFPRARAYPKMGVLATWGVFHTASIQSRLHSTIFGPLYPRCHHPLLVSTRAAAQPYRIIFLEAFECRTIFYHDWTILRISLG